MGVSIEVLKASRGDCILITIVQDGLPYTIIIDGGTGDTYTYKNKKGKRTFGALKDKLEQLRQEGKHIDLLIITHVDDDHIGGIIRWFEDEIPSKDFVRRIWLNDDIEITVDKSLDNTSRQAASLKQKLDENGIQHENIIVAFRAMCFDWGRIIVLAPSAAHHNVVAKHIAKDLDNSTTDRYDQDIETLLKEKYEGGKCTPENDASIAFLLQTNEGENCLLLGDANIDTVMDSLKHFDWISLPLECSWVKLSHHGSKSNFKPELLDLIKAENFIVSTNGSRHGHPDKEVIAWIVDKTNANLWFNYPERAKRIFTDKDKTQYPSLENRIKAF